MNKSRDFKKGVLKFIAGPNLYKSKENNRWKSVNTVKAKLLNPAEKINKKRLNNFPWNCK